MLVLICSKCIKERRAYTTTSVKQEVDKKAISNKYKYTNLYILLSIFHNSFKCYFAYTMIHISFDFVRADLLSIACSRCYFHFHIISSTNESKLHKYVFILVTYKQSKCAKTKMKCWTEEQEKSIKNRIFFFFLVPFILVLLFLMFFFVGISLPDLVTSHLYEMDTNHLLSFRFFFSCTKTKQETKM